MLRQMANRRFKYLRFSQNRIHVCADKNTPNVFPWIKCETTNSDVEVMNSITKIKQNLVTFAVHQNSDLKSLYHHTLPYPRTIGR